MERLSQLLLRNADRLASTDILLINPPLDHLFRHWTDAGRQVRIWNQDFGDYRWFSDNGANVGFGVLPEAGTLPAQLILCQPREKDRLEMMLHFIAVSMPRAGSLWLVGNNDAGIKSAGKRLHHQFGQAVHTDSARHGALFIATQPLRTDSGADGFTLEQYQQKWLLGSPPGELRMVSLPSTFAHGRLDKGTETLLGVLSRLQGKDRPSGNVLDFGCGIGIIGLTLLLRDPAIHLTLLDDSALALESARLSLLANGMEADLLPSNGLREVRQQFDWIVSNPPFHRGVTKRYDIARDFFQEARRALTRQGKMLLVCNRHLPYEGWLTELFEHVAVQHETAQFKVLCVSRPRN
jgi:16S rRNA (guanine1207-N2)-methyltransferase